MLAGPVIALFYGLIVMVGAMAGFAFVLAVRSGD